MLGAYVVLTNNLNMGRLCPPQWLWWFYG